MKYSMLSIAALVAPALGNPAYYWRQYLSRPMHPADAGTLDIYNQIPSKVHVDVEPQGYKYNLAPEDEAVIPGAPSAQVIFNKDIEVGYVSRDRDTFTYFIRPTTDNDDFDGCVIVTSHCGTLSWCPGYAPSGLTCKAGTNLHVELIPYHRHDDDEFLL
ncbi:hypothetical protein CNMCM5623_006993 [Aspergillus felis]|uniref:Uncharacterized protein n=1 Tax=Aspergillus felis TaxID=1287682 RepID=A0A8H6V8X7_9EURO|nr:hypothetical protein CNMCM5623_006993 [Aspergillus felis]KAF7181992.1 hypothetical protein CNMCM7691_001380 [Aspergillus felis]